MVPDKKYYKLLHEKGGLGRDTVIVSSDTFRGKPYLTIDFSDCTEHKQFSIDLNDSMCCSPTAVIMPYCGCTMSQISLMSPRCLAPISQMKISV